MEFEKCGEFEIRPADLDKNGKTEMKILATIIIAIMLLQSTAGAQEEVLLLDPMSSSSPPTISASTANYDLLCLRMH